MDTNDYTTLGYTVKKGAKVRSLRTGIIYTVTGVGVTYLSLTDDYGNTASYVREDFHELYEEV